MLHLSSSRNGIVVNGNKLGKGIVHSLKHGDEINFLPESKKAQKELIIYRFEFQYVIVLNHTPLLILDREDGLTPKARMARRNQLNDVLQQRQTNVVTPAGSASATRPNFFSGETTGGESSASTKRKRNDDSVMGSKRPRQSVKGDLDVVTAMSKANDQLRLDIQKKASESLQREKALKEQLKKQTSLVQALSNEKEALQQSLKEAVDQNGDMSRTLTRLKETIAAMEVKLASQRNESDTKCRELAREVEELSDRYEVLEMKNRLLTADASGAKEKAHVTTYRLQKMSEVVTNVQACFFEMRDKMDEAEETLKAGCLSQVETDKDSEEFPDEAHVELQYTEEEGGGTQDSMFYDDAPSMKPNEDEGLETMVDPPKTTPPTPDDLPTDVAVLHPAEQPTQVDSAKSQSSSSEEANNLFDVNDQPTATD